MDETDARALQMCVQQLNRVFRKDVPPLEGVSRSAVRVLGVVARDEVGEGVHPGAIAEELGMTSSNVAAALREMEAAGYVVRRRSQDDGRRIVVTLTEHGGLTVEAHRSLRASRLRETLEESLTVAEQRQLIATIPLLSKLAAAHANGKHP